MSVVDIVLISAGGVFLIVFLLYIIQFVRRSKKIKQMRDDLSAVYGDKNLAKMEYDVAVFEDEDEETADGSGSAEEPAGTRFAKIDSEGVEEITGTYDASADKD